MPEQMTDAEFVRDLGERMNKGNDPARNLAYRMLVIAKRLEKMDAPEPSEADCIVWAMRNGYRTPPEVLADIRLRMKEAANAQAQADA